MPGVKEIECYAFYGCKALSYIECGKLEIIREWAFNLCQSLRSIDLPSIKIVERSAFACCSNLINVYFGKELETLDYGAFRFCISLERIALPLKDGLITSDGIFQMCVKLNNVDLVGGVDETVTALLMEEWQTDMNEEIDSINQILLSTSAGTNRYLATGGKAQAIRAWITTLLRKIIYYKAEHRSCLNEATTALKSSLPNDIVFKNILPFVELPSYTFDGED